MRDMKETQLTPLHRRLGASMTNEYGWQMPQQYTDLLHEHMSTRSACGIFDISNLGKFRLTGNGAQEYLDGILSNRVGNCRDGHTQETLMLTTKGMILDRVTLCRISAGRFFIIGSASQVEADLASLRRFAQRGALELEDETDTLCAIALVGPEAGKVLSRVHFAVEIPAKGEFCCFRRGGQRCILTRAGLINNDSMELFCPAATGIGWFEQLMAAGAIPCGLQTREILRLEQGRTDVKKDAAGCTPASAGLSHLCTTDKDTGSTPPTDSDAGRLVSLHCSTPGHTLSPGDTVHDHRGRAIGNITSSATSPANGHSYAIAYVSTEHSTPGTSLWVKKGDASIKTEVKALSQ